MIDWKIIAASFGALLLISTTLTAGLGVGDFFGNLINTLTSWLNSSPLGFLGGGGSRNKEVDITLYPSSMTIKPDASATITINDMRISKFKGDIYMDFFSKNITLSEPQSKIIIEAPITSVIIQELKINKFAISNIGFSIQPNITSDNGTLQITDFLGQMSVNANSVNLKGNASVVKAKIGGLEWELKS